MAEITLDSILDALSDLAAQGDRHVAAATHALQLVSPAASEGVAFAGRPGALGLFDYIHKRASQSIVASGDALRGLSRLCRSESLKTSPGGTARDVIESAAVCSWLTQIGCPVKERIERSGRLWLHDLDEMRKLSNAQSLTDSDAGKAATSEDLANILDHQAKVRDWLKAEGIDEKGMVPSTQLVKDVCDDEFEYRLWSNLSHGNPYALQEIRAMHGAGEGAATAILHLTTVSVDAYSRALASYVKFFRPDMVGEMSSRLDGLYDRLGMDEGDQRDFLR